MNDPLSVLGYSISVCPQQCDGVQFTPNISDDYFDYQSLRSRALSPPMSNVTYVFNISHSSTGTVTAMQYCYVVDEAILSSSEPISIFTYLQLKDPGNGSKIMVVQKIEVSSFPGTRKCDCPQDDKVYCCDHLGANFSLESFFGITAYAGPLSLSDEIEKVDGYFFQVNEIIDDMFSLQNFSLQSLLLVRFIIGMFCYLMLLKLLYSS